MATSLFGEYVRKRRTALLVKDVSFSLRRVALVAQIEPSYLSKIERGISPPPSEGKIKLLAGVLGEDPDLLLALAGKISTDLQKVIRKRPRLFAELIRQVRNAPNDALAGMIREARAKYGAGE